MSIHIAAIFVVNERDMMDAMCGGTVIARFGPNAFKWTWTIVWILF